ncbi:hypothetical protein EVJ58_g2491 [Rhodofomes roseus]|uniref:Uncharacterized protein n=1 Tax=Rhodofomes roseus TaxID=34475 RepID=A0A4Y9YSX5_9APHY|nr:hypothetical protein EVJ58_g2491 [Rhodofomes roseus]
MLGDIMLYVATLAILHAAYSTYEQKTRQIVFEAIAALILGIVGSAIRTPELREVTWRSEMKRRSAEEQDPRLSFTTFAQRAGILQSSSAS